MPKEYIEREAVLYHKWKVRSYDPSDPDPVTEVVSVSSIMQIPAADVVEVKHGIWTWDRLRESYRCSTCSAYNADRTAFCPNCVAKLKGENNNG